VTIIDGTSTTTSSVDGDTTAGNLLRKYKGSTLFKVIPKDPNDSSSVQRRVEVINEAAILQPASKCTYELVLRGSIASSVYVLSYVCFVVLRVWELLEATKYPICDGGCLCFGRYLREFTTKSRQHQSSDDALKASSFITAKDLALVVLVCWWLVV
jgi:hypothetical protein